MKHYYPKYTYIQRGLKAFLLLIITLVNFHSYGQGKYLYIYDPHINVGCNGPNQIAGYGDLTVSFSDYTSLLIPNVSTSGYFTSDVTPSSILIKNPVSGVTDSYSLNKDVCEYNCPYFFIHGSLDITSVSIPESEQYYICEDKWESGNLDLVIEQNFFPGQGGYNLHVTNDTSWWWENTGYYLDVPSIGEHSITINKSDFSSLIDIYEPFYLRFEYPESSYNILKHAGKYIGPITIFRSYNTEGREIEAEPLCPSYEEFMFKIPVTSDIPITVVVENRTYAGQAASYSLDISMQKGRSPNYYYEITPSSIPEDPEKEINFTCGHEYRITIEKQDVTALNASVTESEECDCAYDTTITVPPSPPFTATMNPITEYPGGYEIANNKGNTTVKFTVKNSRTETVRLSILGSPGSGLPVVYEPLDTLSRTGSYYSGTISTEVSAGSYIFTVNDGQGCAVSVENSHIANIFYINEPRPISYDTTITHAKCSQSCYGGEGKKGKIVISDIKGGLDVDKVFRIDGYFVSPVYNSGSNTYTIDTVPGVYELQIADGIAGLPNQTGKKAITINSSSYIPSISNSSITTSPPSSFCLNDGKVKFNTTPNSPYPKKWGIDVSHFTYYGTISGFTNDSIQHVYIENTDAGCIAKHPVYFTPRDTLSVTLLDTVAPTCNGKNDGYAELQFNNVANTLEIRYSDSYTNKINDSTYRLRGAYGDTTIQIFDIIDDARQCTVDYTLSIPYKQPITISNPITTDIKNFGEPEGTASFQILGGNDIARTIIIKDSDSGGSDFKHTINTIADSIFVYGLKGAYNGFKYIVSIEEDSTKCYSEPDTFRIYAPQAKLELNCDITNDIKCYGDTNGVIELSAAEGWGSPYAYYQIVGTDTLALDDSVVTNLPDGDYIFKVVDDRGGQSYDTVSFTDREPILATINSVINNKCYGDIKGEIHIEAEGGTKPYHFLDTVGITNLSNITHSVEDAMLFASKLKVDSYSFIVSDSLGCITDTLKQNITSAPKIDLHTALTHTTCAESNGVIEGWATGGKSPFAYNFIRLTDSDTLAHSNIAEGAHVLEKDISAGQHTFLVTDNNNCSADTTIDINNSKKPVVNSVSATDVKCYGDTNGEILATATIGNAPITKYYLFINNNGPQLHDSSATGNFNNLTNSEYSISVNDNMGCTSIQYPVTIAAPEELLLKGVTTTPVINKGGNSGKIVANINGGNTGVKTLWVYNTLGDSVISVASANYVAAQGLSGGYYNLLLKDAKECSYTVDSVKVAEPDSALGFKLVATTNPLCKANTGSFTVQGFGGWGNYEYSYNQAFTSLNVFESLNAGTFPVTVKDDMGGLYTEYVTLTGPDSELNGTIIDSVSPSCNNNGVISVDVSGGVPHYTMVFNADTLNLPSAQTVVYDNLDAGFYNMELTDSNGCIFKLHAQLSDTNKLQIHGFNVSRPLAEGSTNGWAQVLLSGGKQPLVYNWSTIAGAPLSQNKPTLTNVGSGHYMVNISGQGGCSLTNIVYIPSTNDYKLSIVDIQNETALNAANGYVTLTSDIDSIASVTVTDSIGTQIVYTTPDLSAGYNLYNDTIALTGLSAGSYHVLSQTVSGETMYADFNIEEYKPIEITISNVNYAKRKDEASGSVSVNIAGGAGGNTIEWQCLTNPQQVLTPVNGSSGSVLSNITGGTYVVKVTDQFNNVTTDTIVVEEPDSFLQISLQNKEGEKCYGYNNAWATFNALGGWGDYQFSINPDSNYTNSAQFRNLYGGNQYFYVVDKGGALDSVEVNIHEPALLAGSVSKVIQPSCNGDNNGKFVFGISGGTAPYRVAYISDSAWRDTSQYSNLAAGTYTYAVTDTNNCYAQPLVAIMTQPDTISVKNANIKHTSCGNNNGAVAVALQGGTPPYSYQWADFNFATISTDSAIANLVQNGVYTLNSVDRNNCPHTMTVLINPSSAPAITDILVNNALCHGDSTGTAEIKAITNAVPYAPYTITWSNADTGLVSTHFAKGMHYAQLTDTNNCIAQRYFNVNSPDSMKVYVDEIKNVQCYGYSNGRIAVYAEGGVGNYLYKWSNNANTAIASSLTANDYTVVVTDSNNCSVAKTYTVKQPDPLVVSLGNDVVICPEGEHIFDGQNYASHQWIANGTIVSNDRYLTVAEPANYYLTVTNSAGCFAYDTVNLSVDGNFLQSNFLVSSQAYVNDTLNVFELSNIVLDSLVWVYNSDAFTNLTPESDPDYMLQLQANDTGYFNITLQGYTGGCSDAISKQVTIIMPNDSLNTQKSLGYKESLIKSLVIIPNPSNGIFSVKVELREESDIDLTTYNIYNGLIIDERTEYGNSDYYVDYNLSGLSEGLYLMSLQAGGERRQVRIVIAD